MRSVGRGSVEFSRGYGALALARRGAFVRRARDIAPDSEVEHPREMSHFISDTPQVDSPHAWTFAGLAVDDTGAC